MKHDLSFWVLGGDMRQMWLARQLADYGHTVRTWGMDGFSDQFPSTLDGIELADCVVLPMPVVDGDGFVFAPFSSEKLDFVELLGLLSPRSFVCGGRVGDEVLALGEDSEIIVHDYYAREELVVANAVPTAEGCLQVAMERLPITLHGARVLVIGYGRVGRATAMRFGALGANVTVAARRYEQLALAQSDGFDSDRIDQLEGYLCSYHCVVNTVPALVLGEKELTDLEQSALIIDLASGGVGVDHEVAARLERLVVVAPSLPGKVAPATAGEII
ncbi:MAG: dipicolinate synthase subunit DpsA, partial [Eubacteriales bacterium]